MEQAIFIRLPTKVGTNTSSVESLFYFAYKHLKGKEINKPSLLRALHWQQPFLLVWKENINWTRDIYKYTKRNKNK